MQAFTGIKSMLTGKVSESAKHRGTELAQISKFRLGMVDIIQTLIKLFQLISIPAPLTSQILDKLTAPRQGGLPDGFTESFR